MVAMMLLENAMSQFNKVLFSFGWALWLLWAGSFLLGRYWTNVRYFVWRIRLVAVLKKNGFLWSNVDCWTQSGEYREYFDDRLSPEDALEEDLKND